MGRRKMAFVGVSLMVAGAVMAACGSTASGTIESNAKPPSPKTQIQRAFVTFFDGTAPARTKIKLLQNGSQFATVIDAQAKSSIAKGTSAKVSKVTIISPATASVVYTIYLGGQPALKDQSGEAVKLSGAWKVGDASFCGLISLEGTKVPACAAFEKNS